MEPGSNSDLPELNILKQDLPPPEGLLGRVEASLFDRIEKFERDLSPEKIIPPWEAAVASDEAVPTELVDTTEKKLFDRISQSEGVAPWELYLKKDVTAADLTALEKRLSYSIPEASTPYAFPLLFSTVSLAISKYKKVLMVLLILALGLSAFFGWRSFIDGNSPLASTVTAEKGRSEIVRESQTVRSAPGQMLVLSNERGTVFVENGAAVTILEARHRRWAYAVDFQEYSSLSAGRIIFSVTKKKAGREFSVATKEYVVHVVGTVFRLTPQAQGRTALAVLEGSVRIEGAGISALVTAGSTFAFNDKAGIYGIGAADTVPVPAPLIPSAPETVTAHKSPASQFHHVNRAAPPSRDSLLELAARLEAPDWKKSVESYRAVLARPGSSAYSREIAQFSIGRMLCEHGAPSADVRAAFNAYLNNFPGGSFAGESYLRLADLEYKTDPGKALRWYEKYLKEFPITQNTAAAEYKAGLILLQQNKRGRAAAMLSSALVHAKNYPADQVAAIKRTLDNAKSSRNDSAKNGSLQ